MSELENDKTYNTCLVINNGKLMGKARKAMLTQGYDSLMYSSDFLMPVFEYKRVKFGISICHSTSFVEPSQYLRLMGARLLFTPHFNNMAPITQ